jgi:hypothetical protein
MAGANRRAVVDEQDGQSGSRSGGPIMAPSVPPKLFQLRLRRLLPACAHHPVILPARPALLPQRYPAAVPFADQAAARKWPAFSSIRSSIDPTRL